MLILVLSGCATIPAEHCHTTDWYSLGVSDGQQGYRRDRVSRHRQACRETNTEVDIARWQTGYLEGNKTYCSAENGYRIGNSGQSYRGVCQSPAFLKNYNKGVRHYEIKQQISTLESHIYQLKRELRTQKDDNVKREIRYQIRELERDLDRLRYPKLFYDFMLNK